MEIFRDRNVEACLCVVPTVKADFVHSSALEVIKNNFLRTSSMQIKMQSYSATIVKWKMRHTQPFFFSIATNEKFNTHLFDNCILILDHKSIPKSTM